MSGSRADTGLLAGLNPQQREAVTHSGGPCLVLAGAGSGKTRAITHRIAWLLTERGAAGRSICAVTFTNKAAAEMRQRVDALLDGENDELWVLTFHALGLRLLRDAAGAPGAPRPGFFVVDRGEALAVWRSCQAEARVDATDFPPGALFEACSRAVNRLEDPRAWDVEGRPAEQRRAARVYSLYRAALGRRNAVDFDDLLARPLKLIAAGTYRPAPERFRHLLVDEYQDTNRLQYRLLRALLPDDGELIAVGDEDQAIYRWRGADIANVLEFQRDFRGATVVRLEQNYRSTRPILAAAGSLVGHNQERLGKELWTENAGDDVPRVMLCASERSEAVWVARLLAEALRDGLAPSALAVLYRTNAQSRPFEEELAGRGIPFRVIGGPTFFRRVEVRDVLAWLRLAVADDDVALARAVATPSRGVGPAALSVVAEAGNAVEVLLEAAGRPEPEEALRALGCKGRAVRGLLQAAAAIGALRGAADRATAAAMVERVLDVSGYAEYLRGQKDGEDRRANLDELIASAAEGGAATGSEALAAFLDRAALVSDADAGGGGGVNLMTVHAAKGLEFDRVFVTGLEEGLFPHASAIQEGHVEEERRLCYVAMTRARRQLGMSAARLRRVRGRERFQDTSRFLCEIDARLLRVEEEPAAVASRAAQQRHGSGAGRRSGAPRDGTHRAGRRAATRRRAARPVDPAARGSGELAPRSALVEGAAVFHPMFGPGRITATQGGGDKLKLTVAFARAGTKQLIASFAKLQLLAR